MYRKGGYIVARVFGLIAVALMAALVAVQTPYVQTRLTKKLMDKLSSSLDALIDCREVKVMSSGVILLKDLTIIDRAPYTADEFGCGWTPVDTIFSAQTIAATFSIKSFFTREGIHLGRVVIENGSMHLTAEPEPDRSNLERAFKLKSNDSIKEPGGNLFDIRRVRVRNFRFRLNNFLKPIKHQSDSGLHYDNLDIVASARGHAMRMSGNKMYAVLDRCTAVERSGYRIRSLRGKCEVGQGKMLVENIHLKDMWSDIKVASFSQSYERPSDYNSYIERILMDGRLERTTLALNTIFAFAGLPSNNPAVLEIQGGRLRGYVNDFAVENLSFKEKGSGLSCTLNGSCTGLPNTNSLLLNLKLDNTRFTTAGISHLLSDMSGGKPNDIWKYARSQKLALDASVRGPIDRLHLNGNLSVGSGYVKLDAEVRNLVSHARAMEIGAQLNTHELDVRALTGSGDIGKCSLAAKGRVILHKDMPEITLDTLAAGSIEFRGHNYHNISASGSLADKTASGAISCDDPALKLNLAALADLKPINGTSRYKIMGQIDNADLQTLGLGNRDASSVSMGIYANLVQNSVLHGDAYIDSVKFTDRDGVHDIGNIVFRAFPTDGQQSYRLTSNFVEASMTGSGSFADFIDDLQNISARRSLSALYAVPTHSSETGHYDLDVLFHDSRDIMSLISPGLYIADSTRLGISISRLGYLEGSLVSSRLASGINYLKNVQFAVDNRDNSLNAMLTGDELRAGTFKVSSPAFMAYAQNNDIALGAQFDNEFNAGGGELYLNGQIYRDSTNLLVVKAHPLDSYIRTGDETWSLNESDIILHGSDIYIDGFKISNGEQYLMADGGISRNRKDTLFVNMSDVNLALIDEFLPKRYDIKGKIGGKAFLTSDKGKAMGLLMNFKIDSLSAGGVEAGDIRLSTMLDDESEKIDIFMRNYVHGRDAMYTRGSYGLKDKKLSFNARLNRMPLAIAATFVSGIFSEIDGAISGDITLDGPLDRLSSSSEDLYLNDARVRLAATGVPYTLRGSLRLDNTGLYFDSLQISDGALGNGTVMGALRHDYFHNFALDTRINFNNLEFVNASEHDGGPIYGLLRASGNATVCGPLSSLDVVAMVATSGEGNVHIPVSGSLTGSSGDLLTFTEPVREIDPYEQMLISYQSRDVKSSAIKLHATLTAGPQVKSFIEIDKASGNVISFSGDGTVSASIRPAEGLFNLNGDYNINEGQYQFVVPGVLSRLFEIQRGSSIKFNGSLMDTQLDISAKHEVKTSLSALIADTTSVSTRRLVECSISITDRLRNPQMGFSINIPNLDPTTKSQVESALNTEDKVQKQFVSLLLMESFIPGESSGVFNGSSVLLSNISNLMSNQINSIMQKLEIPLDVHLAYQGISQGTNIFDVAVSTQLLNNRIIVGGSVGNRKYKNSSSSGGEVVGDLDIQVKIDNQGKFRLNLFSHSADEYTSFLDYSQRNGIGISYQKEFNGVGDFLKNMFVSKGKREAKAVEADTSANKQVTIQISDEQ